MNFFQFIPKQFIEIALTRALPVLILNKMLFFCIYKYTKNACVVDVGYTVGHFLAGSTYAYYAGDLKSFDTRIKLIILGLWTVRLSYFLWKTRIMTGYQDPRYEVVFKKYPPGSTRREFAVFGQYFFQGLVVLATSSPLYWMFKNQLAWNMTQLKGPHILNYLSLMIAVLGIIGENMADNQLQTYKDNRAQYKQGHIFQEGIWSKSRHPNLFFDQVTWYAFAASGMFSINDIAALTGPFLLHLVMDRLTVPISEAYMKKSRGDKYLEYLKTTNKYWPF